MKALRLSAWIVNYATGAHALACARSLMAAWRAGGRSLMDLSITVVDNASPEGEDFWLMRLQRMGVKVVRSPENTGYAAGLETARALETGERADVVALLNADLEFLPLSLEPLLDHLERRPRVGAVAPLMFLDPGCTLALPPNRLPSPTEISSCALAQISRLWALWRARRRTREALRCWTSEEPFAAPMLSGACLLLRREALERLGTLMDIAYALYFEDTDLCQRLRAAGYELHCVPEARVVHYWARSSGQASGLSPELQQCYSESRERYLRRWHKWPARTGLAMAESLVAYVGRRRRLKPLHAFTDLGPLDQPPELSLPSPARHLIEIGLEPTLLLAGGALGRGRVWRCSAELWEWLVEGVYYLRALDAENGRFMGAWTFQKTTPARSVPRSVEAELWDGRAGSAA